LASVSLAEYANRLKQRTTLPLLIDLLTLNGDNTNSRFFPHSHTCFIWPVRRCDYWSILDTNTLFERGSGRRLYSVSV